MTQDQQSGLFAKYFSGNASPEEEKQLMEWVKADPAHEHAFNQGMKIWEIAGRIGGEEIDFDAHKGWQALRPRLGNRAGSPYRRPAKQMLMMAAAIVVLIGLSFAGMLFFNEKPLPAKEERARPVIAMLKIATQDSSKVFFLPDSSKVYLNRNSRLSYPVEFGNNRNVSLIGEAFFEVRRDTLHPFTVYASGTSVRVLGTSFNVKESNDEVWVDVVSGKVIFAPDSQRTGHAVVLKAGDRGTFSKANSSFSKTKNTDAAWWRSEKKQNFIKRTINKIKRTLKKTK